MRNGPTVVEESAQTVAARFARVVAAHGERFAVCAQGHRWTYRRLEAISNSVAANIDAVNADRHRPVALLMGHDAELIAAIVAVLKTGRPYVVLNNAESPERMRAVWEQSDARLLLVDRDHQESGFKIPPNSTWVVRCDETESTRFSSHAEPDAPASLTFTSGTTGVPKGVCQTHRGLLHHCENYTEHAGLGPEDRISLVTPCHLAASLSSLWGALMNGAALYPLDLRTEGINALPAWIERNGITVLHLVPGAFRTLGQLVEQSGRRSSLRSLRLIRLGGEGVGRADFDLFKRCTSDACRLLVAYSSTETGAACMYSLGHDSQVTGDRIPVGRPLAGMDVSVVGEDGRTVATGQMGRIVIGSRFVAQGYWRDPLLTAERFRVDTSEPDVRVFQTSDLGRLRPDGMLEHLGRADARIKVRGQWVDPAEVESALLKMPGISEAAVVGRDDGRGQTRVVAFVASEAEHFAGAGSVRRTLREPLPAHMVPSEIIRVDGLPKTAGGKIDRTALLSLVQPNVVREEKSLELEGLELNVGKVWGATLGHADVKHTDDFFADLGGTSMDAARMLSLLEMELGRRIAINSLLQNPTLRGFTAHLGEGASAIDDTALTCIQRGDPRRTPLVFAHGDIFGGGVYCRELARQIGVERPFYAMSPAALAHLAASPSVRSMAGQFVAQIRSVQPSGPYLIGGFCNGGFVAFEASRQLEAAGQHVELLVLVRAYAGRLRWPGVLRLIDQSCGWMEEGTRLALAARVLDHLQAWRSAGEEGISGIVGQGIRQSARRLGKWSGRLDYPTPAPAPPDERSARLVEFHRRAMLSYRPRPYRGRMLIFRPVEEEGLVFGDPSTGWSRYARRFVPFTLPGEHFTCMTRYSEALAQVLTTYLRPK